MGARRKAGGGRSGPARKASSRGRTREPRWAALDDERLLALRFRDLGIGVEGTVLEGRVARLHDELEGRGVRLRPHVWLSTEWFSPDGVPGIAAPFYLAHPRLMQLERRQMLEVEGQGEHACMRILRHEAGHAVDTAWRLHRRKDFRKIFGPSRPYPETYKPRPFSRSYVLHLDAWYAQAHPAEDFAETFAVWLTPGGRWRQAYRGWPALRKLRYVDALMEEIRDTPPAVRSRARPDAVARLSTTLAEHYAWKHSLYGTEHPDFYDRDLRRLFSDDPQHRGREGAAAFLRRLRPELREIVAHWTGLSQYTIDQVLRDMIGRAKELKLRVHRGEKETRLDTTVMLTVQTMSYLYSGRHRVPL